MSKIKTFRVAAYTPCTRTQSWPNLGQRIDEVKNRISTAATYLNMKFNNDPADLNIFVAPEWCFQKEHNKQKEGATFHTSNDLALIIKGMKDVSSQHPNLLIIPGSVIWSIPDSTRGEIVYNTVFVFYAGNLLHTYHKSDWGGDTYRPGTFATTMKIEGVASAWGNILRSSYGIKKGGKTKNVQTNSHFFECRGLLIGVEVCADHIGGMMRKEYIDKWKNGKGIDLHIIVACGMSPSSEKVVAKKGGYIIACEGFYDNDVPTVASEGKSNKLNSLAIFKVSNRNGSVLQSEGNCQLMPNITEIQLGQLTKKFIVMSPLNKRIVIDMKKYILKSIW
ncbi:MAG: hypothetical protein KAS04_01515 [Candidatus Aenigmarchaeota archaeon]|nr:hypothetical protein [Candidatus Aenigmarchaeota archaeon]